MIHEVAPDIHRIEVPLPRNPLRAINAYLVRGADRCLMIDTGMNRPECLDAVRQALRALAVDLGRTDFFITHGHADHVGLVSELPTGASRIFLHPQDAAIVLDPDLWKAMAADARTHGFPDPDAAVLKHPGRRYGFSGHPDFTPLSEGDHVRVGRYVFRCVETPGHTPGHMCLYEPDARLLFSGDHILDTITPNISAWGCGADPLAEFIESLDKTAAYSVAITLPAHRAPIRDHVRRIEELKAHHRIRMQEALDVLAGGAQTAYRVAAQMAWNLDCARWDDFPVPQQWFATGEALAHLLHLERQGRIWREDRKGQAYFSL